MKAYKHLIKFALSCEYTVSVWDGEEWQVTKSEDYAEIVDAVESVEEAVLKIRREGGDSIASVTVSAYGLEDDETVVDYGLCSFMEDWEESYSLTHGA